MKTWIPAPFVLYRRAKWPLKCHQPVSVVRHLAMIHLPQALCSRNRWNTEWFRQLFSYKMDSNVIQFSLNLIAIGLCMLPSFSVPAVSISALVKSVAIYSGFETSTLMLWSVTSARNVSLNAWSACFDAANDERNGIGTLPATLLMNTILPDFRAIMPGKMAMENGYIVKVSYVECKTKIDMTDNASRS